MHILAPGERSRAVSRNLAIHGYGGSLVENMHFLSRRVYESKVFARKTVLHPRLLNVVIGNFERVVTRWSKQLKLDIVEGQQEIAARACINASRKGNFRCVSRFQNVWFEECRELGLLSEGDPGLEYLRDMTQTILEQSDKVITLTSYMKEYFLSHFEVENDSQIACVQPGTHLRPPSTARDSRLKRIVYSGTLSELEGLELFIQAARILGRPAEFSICGRGPKESAFRRMAGMVYPSMCFDWFDKRTDYYNHLSSSYVGVVPWANTPSRRLGFPMKLLDYISVGLPVLASAIGSWSDIVQEHGFGLLCSPNPSDWARSMRQICDDEATAHSMGKKALEAGRNVFNWNISATSLLEIYNSLH